MNCLENYIKMEPNDLRRKGWTNQEVMHADNVIKNSNLIDKSRAAASSNKVVFWSVIFVIIIGNFILSLLFIPFLLVMHKIAVDVIIVVVGLAFGTLFTMLLFDVEGISNKNHAVAALLIPILALVNISVMVKVSMAISDYLNINVVNDDPISISAIYVIAFMMPYLWAVFVKKKINLGYSEKIVLNKNTSEEFARKYR